MTQPGDERLRSRFGELRDADERGAPAYRAVLERRVAPVVPHPGRRWLPRFALTLAAAAAIVLAIGVARESRRREFQPQPLSTWRSPTASLLHTPGLNLVSSSTLVSSMLDPVIATSTLRTGTRQ
jgi:hypothetical protein